MYPWHPGVSWQATLTVYLLAPFCRLHASRVRHLPETTIPRVRMPVACCRGSDARAQRRLPAVRGPRIGSTARQTPLFGVARLGSGEKTRGELERPADLRVPPAPPHRLRAHCGRARRVLFARARACNGAPHLRRSVPQMRLARLCSFGDSYPSDSNAALGRFSERGLREPRTRLLDRRGSGRARAKPGGGQYQNCG